MKSINQCKTALVWELIALYIGQWLPFAVAQTFPFRKHQNHYLSDQLFGFTRFQTCLKKIQGCLAIPQEVNNIFKILFLII
jgi:hypothetical protein